MLYARHSSQVYNTALLYCHNAEDAEEVTQDVFIKLFKKAASFKGQSAESTWIYRITVNTALNYIKRRSRNRISNRIGEEEGSIPDFVHPGVLMEKEEEARYMFAAIDQLPEQQKTAFILSYIEDIPRQEVADIMDTSLKAVESLLQRAKKNIRTKLEKTYPNRRIS
jgi:RNA polymerase sigma-70 factor (ECF subfamily)